MHNDHSSKNEQFIHKLFSTIAGHYDFMNTVLSLNRDKYWRSFAIQQAALSPDSKVLDVCCGTGKLTVGLAESLDCQGQVVGLDFCEAMLAIAKERIAASPYQSRITLQQGNALALPFADDSFDCAITAFGLRNLPDVGQALAEMRRVMRPGGKVVSLELAKPTAPGFKQLYYFYFEQILPLLGKLKLGKSGLYSWLPQSLKDYPHQVEVAGIYTSIGLYNVCYHELTGGIVAVHTGVK